jgi:anthranilate synthase component 1
MQQPLTPGFQEFSQTFSAQEVCPVWVEIVADVETPVSAFAKLGKCEPSFLFESAEQNDLIGRYSFVGFGSRLSAIASGKTIRIEYGSDVREFEPADDPLRELERVFHRYQAKRHPSLPGFWGGAVGYLSYDAIRWVEPTVPPPPPDSLGVADMFFWIPEAVLIFDHRRRSIKVVVAALPEEGVSADEAYAAAGMRISDILTKLDTPVRFSQLPVQFDGAFPDASSNTTAGEYYAMVESGQEYIRAGDIFQFVPSQRFSADFAGDALDLYRALRFVNPSPYMFCLRCQPGFSLVGSSPEVHVRLTDRLVEIRPIAGTRPRGNNTAQDNNLANELLADTKERAEHLMLVDLARNDVGRIAEFGSVKVSDFMTIERYSHVMHIVSHVSGQLAGGRSAFDVMRATFPAGTVSGSPKVRAMQIINELEKAKRCVYAGAVGYFRFDGDLDSCIALRTVVLKDGKAHVQAGGGVVADSTPEGEFQETVNKSRAALRAIALAKQLAE